MKKRLILASIAALALSGCGLQGMTTTPPPPATVADKTVLDEQALLSLELAYKAARIAVETGVDAGIIKGATATRFAALDNAAFLGLAVARQAYSAGNARSYAEAITSGRGAVTDLLTLAGKGA